MVTVFWLGPGLVQQGGARLNSSLTWVGGGGGPGQCARGTRGPVHDCLQNVQNNFGDSSAFVSLRPTPHITRTRIQYSVGTWTASGNRYPNPRQWRLCAHVCAPTRRLGGRRVEYSRYRRRTGASKEQRSNFGKTAHGQEMCRNHSRPLFQDPPAREVDKDRAVGRSCIVNLMTRATCFDVSGAPEM